MDLHKIIDLGKAKKLLLISTRDKEGKTYFGKLLVDRLRTYSEKVIYLQPAKGKPLPQHIDSFHYSVDPDFFSKQSERDLIPHANIEWEDYEYIITELPALLTHPFPVDLIGQADYVIMICRANRVWNGADKKILEKLHMAVDIQPSLVLNGTAVYNLEDIIGEIPKRRSPFRRFFKRAITLEFKAKQAI